MCWVLFLRRALGNPPPHLQHNSAHVHRFGAFLLQLSRSGKINWRVMSLEMASGLLLHFEQPFELPGENCTLCIDPERPGGVNRCFD